MSDAGQFIVAELSKNWCNGEHVAPTPPIAEQFELLIALNQQRGYRLHSFQIHRLMVRFNELNETLIAVFERDAEAEA